MRKKIYSSLLAIAILSAQMPAAFADSASVVIPSPLIAGRELTLNIDSSDSDFEYQWLTSDSADGEYTELLSDKSSSYVITPRDKNKYIKAKVVNKSTSEVIVTGNYAHVENLGPLSVKTFNASEKETPDENTFTVDGRKFVLLEEMNGSASHFYVIAGEMYGQKAFDVNSYTRFDPNADGNIGKFLNNEFKTTGNGGIVIPAQVISHIDTGHVWWTEYGLAGGVGTSDYSFTAGISLLSQSEAVKYHGKYGWDPTSDGISGWWSRTQRGSGSGVSTDNILVMMGNNDTNKGKMRDKLCDQSYYVRPTFYLDENFFKEVKCDVSSMGSNIKEILKRYTKEQLAGIYSSPELAKIGFPIELNEFSIGVTAEGNGTASGGGALYEGETAHLTAIPIALENFLGWYDGETLVSTDLAYDFTVTGDINLTAKFTENSCEVTFLDNENQLIDKQRVIKGYVVDIPAAPAKAGYKFKGYYRDNTYTQSIDDPLTCTEDTIVYGKYVEIAALTSSATPPKTLSTLTASYTNASAVSYEYKWYISDDDSTYYQVMGETSNTYKVSNYDMNKYVKATITPVYDGGTNGTPVETDAIHITQLGRLNRTDYSAESREANKANPKQNYVKLGGEEMLILDEYESATESFYVMSAQIKGRKAFDSDNTTKFDPTDSNNIAYLLNNDFLSSEGFTEGGVTYRIPIAIQSYIPTHTWWTEAGYPGSASASDYSVSAKIGLLSRSEYEKYWGKFGWDPTEKGIASGWWLRTGRGEGGTTSAVFVVRGAGGNNYPNTTSNNWANTWNENANSTGQYIRPTYYLNEDVFKNVKADVTTMGSSVKEMILRRYTVDEIKALYTPQELKKIGFELDFAFIESSDIPTKALSTLTVNYKDASAKSFEYEWYISDDGSTYHKVVSQTAQTYVVAANDMDKYIKATVTAVYSGGTKGATQTTDAIHVENLGTLNRTGYSDDRETYKANPEEYMLTAGGEEMIILDVFDDEEHALYVMTARLKGKHAFDPDKTTKFDPDDENNIGYWLNHEFLNETKTVSEDVQKYIPTTTWWTEAGNSGSNSKVDYSVSAKIGLLSRSEYEKYWGKFGWDPANGVSGWWLRSGRGLGGSSNTVFVALGATADNNYPKTEQSAWANTWDKSADTSSYYVRPVFYLTKDFLREIEIDSMGEKAAEAIRSIMSSAEFEALGYNKKELLELGIIPRPEAKDCDIDGKVGVGAQIKGVYSYVGEIAEGATVCGFEISDSIDGEYSNIAEGKVLQVTSDYEGKYIRFFAKPVDSYGTESNTIYYSNAYKVLGAATVSAEGVKVIDESGNEVSSIKDLTKLDVSVDLVNCTAESKNAFVMIFVYNQYHQLLKSKGMKLTISPNSSISYSDLSIDLPAYIDGNYAKLFVWDGLETMGSAQNVSWNTLEE